MNGDERGDHGVLDDAGEYMLVAESPTLRTRVAVIAVHFDDLRSPSFLDFSFPQAFLSFDQEHLIFKYTSREVDQIPVAFLLGGSPLGEEVTMSQFFLNPSV